MKTFIFDLDGTLVTNRGFRYAIIRTPRILNLGVSPEEFYNNFLDTYYFLVANNRTKEAFDWDHVCELTVRRLGYRYRRGLFSRLLIEGIKKGFVFVEDGVPQVLEKLKKDGFKLGILTNGYSWYQRHVLEKTRLRDLFDFIIYLDNLEEPKPSEKAFGFALKFASDRNNIIFVGDHAYYDIYGALHFGLNKVFWVTKDLAEGAYDVNDIWDVISEKAEKYGKKLSKDSLKSRRVIVINKLSSILKFV